MPICAVQETDHAWIGKSNEINKNNQFLIINSFYLKYFPTHLFQELSCLAKSSAKSSTALPSRWPTTASAKADFPESRSDLMTPVSLSKRNPYFGISHLLRERAWPLRMLPYLILLLITPAMFWAGLSAI
jgi:hypothetical protein